MSQGVRLRAAGLATSLLFVITFSLCVGFDLLFPSHADVSDVGPAPPGLRVVELEVSCLVSRRVTAMAGSSC